VVAGAARGAVAPAGSAEARVWSHIPYASTARSHLLDLYLPATGSGPFPVILWVHGGGWAEGSKSLAEYPLPLRVLERGYALASINYRLIWEAKFPAQIDDVKAAVRWLRANAKAYHLDPARIGAWGTSAGGYLVALLGTSGEVPDLEYLGLGNPQESSRVQAVVVWSAPIDFLRMDEHAAAKGCPPYEGRGHSSRSSPESQLVGFPITERPERVKATNPIRYVSPDDPPFLIQHGEFDCIVAPQQSQILYDALAPVIGPDKVTLTYLPAGHGGEPFEKDSNIRLIMDFFDAYFK
jgi:acetyl esterase/lipase